MSSRTNDLVHEINFPIYNSKLFFSNHYSKAKRITFLINSCVYSTNSRSWLEHRMYFKKHDQCIQEPLDCLSFCIQWFILKKSILLQTIVIRRFHFHPCEKVNLKITRTLYVLRVNIHMSVHFFFLFFGVEFHFFYSYQNNNNKLYEPLRINILKFST